MDGREFKDAIFTNFARVGSALGNATRVEIVDVLAQGERSVDQLARDVGATVGNTSRNLQVLAAAGLVARRVEGTSRIYRLAHPSVLAAYKALAAVAELTIAEVSSLANAFFEAEDGVEPMSLEDLRNALAEGQELTLVDVRAREDYEAGHVPGAVNIPVAEIADRLADLPTDAPVVAYCRGPYCVTAVRAVQELREGGIEATRLEAGYPDWILSNET